MSKFEDSLNEFPRPDSALPPDPPKSKPDEFRAGAYPKATSEEINQLRQLLTRRKLMGLGSPPPNIPKTPVYDPEILPHTFENKNHGGTVIHDPQFKYFDNAVDWINFALPDVNLHKWQFETLMELSGYRNKDYTRKYDYTDKDPYMGCMVCANGSGKDMLVNAGFSTFLAASAKNNKAIVTSASADQLKYQTEVHIRRIGESVNKKVCYKMFNSIHFYHQIPELGSDIKLIATDEPGRAEGAHPYHGGKMAIIINEAKSIDEGIYGALSRCSGYSWWLEISSPGEPSGTFYNSFINGIDWPGIPTRPGQYQRRRITAFDCPHISRAHIDNIIAQNGGINSPIVQSSVFANFVAELADIIIPSSMWDYTCHRQSGLRRAGLDIGGGVDTTELIVMNGNYIEGMETTLDRDLAKQTDLMESWFRKYDLKDCSIWADANGIGQAVVANLARSGWKMQGIRFQSNAANPQEYSNLGAECWFNVRDFVRKKIIPKPTDNELFQQLTSRYFKRKALGKYQLEDKPEHIKRNGGKSPNKADAYVMAWIGLRPADFNFKPVTEDKEKFGQHHRLTTHDFMKWMREQEGKAPKRHSIRDKFNLVFGKK